MISKDRNVFSIVEISIPQKDKTPKTCLGEFSSGEYDGKRSFRNAGKGINICGTRSGKKVFEQALSSTKK